MSYAYIWWLRETNRDHGEVEIAEKASAHSPHSTYIAQAPT